MSKTTPQQQPFSRHYGKQYRRCENIQAAAKRMRAIFRDSLQVTDKQMNSQSSFLAASQLWRGALESAAEPIESPSQLLDHVFHAFLFSIFLDASPALTTHVKHGTMEHRPSEMEVFLTGFEDACHPFLECMKEKKDLRSLSSDDARQLRRILHVITWNVGGVAAAVTSERIRLCCRTLLRVLHQLGNMDLLTSLQEQCGLRTSAPSKCYITKNMKKFIAFCEKPLGTFLQHCKKKRSETPSSLAESKRQRVDEDC